MTPPSQPSLLDVNDVEGMAELFPAVWRAAEGLAAPEADTRHAALDSLLAMDAVRIYPLIAYLMATRLTDADVEVRARIVQALGEVFASDGRRRSATEEVRQLLRHHLSQMRKRTVYAILQVAARDPDSSPHVARLFNACPYAGNHLADILASRSSELEVRVQAANFIGQVGYLDTAPALERLLNRLESRQNGQRSMPFAPPMERHEAALLPAIKDALRALDYR